MSRHLDLLDTSAADQQAEREIARLRAEEESIPEDAEFLPVGRVTDGWCGPVIHADERSGRQWRAMERDDEAERRAEW